MPSLTTHTKTWQTNKQHRTTNNTTASIHRTVPTPTRIHWPCNPHPHKITRCVNTQTKLHHTRWRWMQPSQFVIPRMLAQNSTSQHNKSCRYRTAWSQPRAWTLPQLSSKNQRMQPKRTPRYQLTSTRPSHGNSPGKQIPLSVHPWQAWTLFPHPGTWMYAWPSLQRSCPPCNTGGHHKIREVSKWSNYERHMDKSNVQGIRQIGYRDTATKKEPTQYFSWQLMKSNKYQKIEQSPMLA